MKLVGFCGTNTLSVNHYYNIYHYCVRPTIHCLAVGLSFAFIWYLNVGNMKGCSMSRLAWTVTIGKYNHSTLSNLPNSWCKSVKPQIVIWVYLSVKTSVFLLMYCSMIGWYPVLQYDRLVSSTGSYCDKFYLLCWKLCVGTEESHEKFQSALCLFWLWNRLLALARRSVNVSALLVDFCNLRSLS
jgi:hypothetical protein